MGEGSLNPHFLVNFPLSLSPPVCFSSASFYSITASHYFPIPFLRYALFSVPTIIKNTRIKESQRGKIFLMGLICFSYKDKELRLRIIGMSRVKQLINGHFLSDIQKLLHQSTLFLTLTFPVIPILPSLSPWKLHLPPEESWELSILLKLILNGSPNLAA